jgi:alkylation response protein AidB-like acyl-CoA dehydrogenase
MTATAPDQAETGVVLAVAELVPLLRDNARRCERERRLCEENLTALAGNGVFRMTSPRRYGGLELDLPDQVRVLAALGRGCGSTAWVASVYSTCAWFAGLFDDRAQDEVFADLDARVAGVFSPTGVLMPVDGGYRLTGRWAFNTGVLHAGWDVLAAVVQGTDTLLLTLVPVSELSLADDWHPSGLAGTGSNTAEARDVFVPAHRTLPIAGALRGECLSESNRDSPLYRCAFFPFVMANSTGAPLGIAQGAMDAFLERMPGRGITYTHYTVQAEAPVTHLNLADAAVTITAAELLALHTAGTVRDAAMAGRELTERERAAVRGQTAHVVRLARQAVQALSSLSGASSIQDGVPIQRFLRDIQALSLHAALDINTNLEVYGRVIAGVNPNTPFL